MAPTQEILPPSHPQAHARRDHGDVVISPPRLDPGGPISGTLKRWKAERDARAISALAARMRAEGDLFEALSDAMESYIKRQRTLARLQELPDIVATDHARRRAERAEELRELYHRNEIAETLRLKELAGIERELLDAQQALKAQRDHGYGRYELEWKKRHCDILELELSAADRRALLREHLAEVDRSDGNGPERGYTAPTDPALDDALYEARAELLANGLDTSRIDAVIERRRTKKQASAVG